MNKQDLEVAGNINVGPSVKIGYLPQIVNFANDELSLLEHFKNEFGKL